MRRDENEIVATNDIACPKVESPGGKDLALYPLGCAPSFVGVTIRSTAWCTKPDIGDLRSMAVTRNRRNCYFVNKTGVQSPTDMIGRCRLDDNTPGLLIWTRVPFWARRPMNKNT